MNNEIEPQQQADGYSLDDVHIIDQENDGELVEELADTVTIEQLFDQYTEEVNRMFSYALEVSLMGNPVRTHIELQSLTVDVEELTYQLRTDLTEKLANRADVISEQGGLLRKQVIDDTLDEKGI